jgi:hypothetical protein
MSRPERFIVGGLLMILLFLVPAFVLHSAPRFAGTLSAFALGTAAATLMVSLLIYPVAKYATAPGSLVRRFIPLRSLLAFHVYAGVIGAFLGILHTGHHYQSPLGIALVISMLVVVVTGFVGRYYLPDTISELRDQQSRLAALRSAYDRTAIALAARHTSENAGSSAASSAFADVSALRLVDGIADLEYAVGSQEAVKRIFTPWIVLHIVAAIAMYFLLTLHVATEIYFGLRWLP